MDRFTGLMVFVKAVDLGSFSATGEALNMSSQLVGRHIQELERRLGVRLLNRTTRRQSPTDFGRMFYERARIILAEVDAAENLAAETRALPKGRLRISAPVSFGIHILSLKLPAYMERYPEVEIDLRLNNRLVDLIDEGFDVVFRVGELTDSRLIARPLAPYRLVLCASREYMEKSPPLLTPMDLVHHRCLAYSHTELRTHWTFDGAEGRVVVPVSSCLMVDHGEPLLQAALAGMGIMLQPCELVRHALAEGKLVELLPGYKIPTRPMHVIYAQDQRMTPKLRTFLDYVVENFSSDF